MLINTEDKEKIKEEINKLEEYKKIITETLTLMEEEIKTMEGSFCSTESNFWHESHDLIGWKGKLKDKISSTDLANYFDQKEGYTGSVSVMYSNGNYTIKGWLSSTKYIIEDKDDSLTTDDVADSDGRAASTTCGQ